MALSSDDGRLFVADKAALSIRVLDPSTGNLLAGLPLDSVPQALSAFSPRQFTIKGIARAVESLFFGIPPIRASSAPNERQMYP
jgi:hypothetical protein